MSPIEEELVLRGAMVFDGTGTDPRRGTVHIGAGRITAVDFDGNDPTPPSGCVVDVQGLTLLPGLIDAHTHLGAVDLVGTRRSLAEVAAEVFANLRMCLEAGFTTVRELGGLDGGVARLTARGELVGPRILPSGPLLCQSAGHGDLADPYTGHDPLPVYPGLTQFSMRCDGAEEVRRAARLAFRRGATQLKLCLSGGVVSHTDRLEDVQFTTEEIRAAVEEAQTRRTYVTAHAHNPESIRRGLDAGLTCFEHGVLLDESAASAMAKAGAALVPTLSNGELMVENWQAWRIPEEILPRARYVRDRMYDAVRIAHENGISIGSGSDLLGPNQSRRGLEITLKSRVLGPVAALISATRQNAQIIGRGHDLGTIEPGKIADIVAVAGEPLTKPEALEDPNSVLVVIKQGRVVKDIR